MFKQYWLQDFVDKVFYGLASISSMWNPRRDIAKLVDSMFLIDPTILVVLR